MKLQSQLLELLLLAGVTRRRTTMRTPHQEAIPAVSYELCSSTKIGTSSVS
jgi:hypothetical protein